MASAEVDGSITTTRCRGRALDTMAWQPMAAATTQEQANQERGAELDMKRDRQPDRVNLGRTVSVVRFCHLIVGRWHLR